MQNKVRPEQYIGEYKMVAQMCGQETVKAYLTHGTHSIKREVMTADAAKVSTMEREFTALHTPSHRIWIVL